MNDDDKLTLMPFRPYKRFVSQIVPPDQLYNFVQTSVLTGTAEEAELQALGGRPAVLNSIRRHVPSFDPAKAASPYAPDWATLKPYLVKAGLDVDEATTLTDIKVFLDDHEPTPSTGRLAKDTPASNYQTIANLIGPAEIVGVFDPYLENKSLTTITTILSFVEGSIARGIRLLGSANMTQGRIPRLTMRGVAAWLEELCIDGEARLFAPGTKEHRRFLLLSDRKALILGHSFNAIHKNEAARIESGTEDSVFFDDTWNKATPLK